MSAPPRISIVMPVHNRDWCVAEAIDSVLATGEAGLELVIVDDGSTDGTAAILAQYAAREPERIRLLSHAGRANRGIACSRNLGVAASRGDFLAFLDSDDLYLPERFRHAIPWLECHPRSLACIEPYSLANMREPSANRVVRHLTEVPAAHLGWLRAMLFSNTYWNTPTITFRRASLTAFGKFDERLEFAEETALWLRLAATQNIGVAQEQIPVACVRRHTNHSWDPADRLANFGNYLHILLDVTSWSSRHAGLAPEVNAMLVHKLGRFLVEVLSDAGLPLSWRLSAWARAMLICPRLVADRQIVANLARAPFRRQHDHAL